VIFYPVRILESRSCCHPGGFFCFRKDTGVWSILVYYSKGFYERRDTMEKKLRAMLIFPAALLIIFALNYDRYSELLYIAYILMSLNLIMLGIQAVRENKRSLFAYGITAISLLTIFLSLKLLLK
jgi:hypothetical protein